MGIDLILGEVRKYLLQIAWSELPEPFRRIRTPMPEEIVPTVGRRRLWVAGGAVLVVLTLVVALGLLQQGPEGDSVVTSSPSPTESLPPQDPVEQSGTASMTVPEETRFAGGEFPARAGSTYLVTFELGSEKPEGSGGESMYLGVTLGCSPEAGGPGASIGGTQNILTGEPSSYTNQFLFTAEVDGQVECSFKASAPYDDVASVDTTFDLVGTWRAEPVVGAAFEAPAAKRLPMTIPAGGQKAAFTHSIPLEDLIGDGLRVLTSLHVTTCTGINGSREGGRAWCSEGDLDEKGSTAAMETRIELLAPDGEVCDVIATQKSPAVHVSVYRHHYLMSQELEAHIPADPCSDAALVTVLADNGGPAPLVVHESNSSLVVVEEDG